MTSINPYEPARERSVPSPVGALPVRATGVVTAEDALSALAAVGKWRPWRTPLLVLPVMLLAGVAWLLNPRGGWFGPAMMVVAGLVLLSAPFRAKGKFAKTWNARPEHAHPIVWTFSDEGLFIESINSKHLHSWSTFVSARVLPDKLILTQHGGQMFNFIPRRCFNTDADWQTVCQLIASKLPGS